jgi:hypothetical protein
VNVFNFASVSASFYSAVGPMAPAQSQNWLKFAGLEKFLFRNLLTEFLTGMRFRVQCRFICYSLLGIRVCVHILLTERYLWLIHVLPGFSLGSPVYILKR